VSVTDRLLYVLAGPDTITRLPIGVVWERTLAHGNHSWSFRAPRGDWRVLRKLIDPVWTPPDWHYAEAARSHGLRLRRLPQGGLTLVSGGRLEIRRNAVGIIFPGSAFAELPVDEHIVFDSTLFIPPVWTVNRRVSGTLGAYALDLGRGYLIHGTWDLTSIGEASTHGCIRVGDEDMRWLYEHVPVGARVTIR
jgi:lipoprotein-anchoring transpeptidase ErfK/SrfK